MRRSKLVGVATLIVLVAFVSLAVGCGKSDNSSTSTTATVLRPEPQVESVVASTSGVQSAYYTTLDIKVKNNGAKGTFMVQGSVTQSGKTSQLEMPVFLKQGGEYELELTFPLVWGGGEFTCDAQAIVP